MIIKNKVSSLLLALTTISAVNMFAAERMKEGSSFFRRDQVALEGIAIGDSEDGVLSLEKENTRLNMMILSLKTIIHEQEKQKVSMLEKLEELKQTIERYGS